MESTNEGMKPVPHGGSWQDRGDGSLPCILPQLRAQGPGRAFSSPNAAVGSGSSSCQSLVPPAAPAPCGDPSSRCPGPSSSQGQPQVFLWAHSGT